MPNQLETLMPLIVARGLLHFRERAILPRLVNSSFSSDAARRGDAIDVPISSPVAVSDVTPGKTFTGNIPDTSISSVSITLDNWKRAAFYLTDDEMAKIESSADFIPMQMAEAIHALAGAVNQSIIDMHKLIAHGLGLPGEIPFQPMPSSLADVKDWHGVTCAIQARRFMNKAAAPKTGRFAIIDYDMEANALGLPQFHDADKAGTTSVPMEGEIGRKFGIDWFSSDLLPNAGNDVGEVSIAKTNQEDATEITVNARHGAINPGDSFVIKNDDNQIVHRVKSVVAASNTAHAKITLHKPIGQALNTSHKVIFKSSHKVGLVLHRDAVALAMRPLSAAGLESGLNGQIMSVSDPQTGLSLRLEVTRQYKQTMWEFDVLWGVAMMRPELACVIYGDA